ncbi:MAG: YCF48-related protein [Ignavibacteria bacterium]|nr:YCF48-related protein [Ignavibacteria bacterium]
MRISYYLSIVIIFSLVLLAGCENAVKQPEQNGPITTDSSNGSTWMYTDNTGNFWYMYQLDYSNAINSIISFNADPYSSIIAGGDKGIIIKSVDGGGTWSVDTTSAGKQSIRSMSGTGVDLNGVAVGNGGTILLTNTDGGSWTKVTGPTSVDLLSVKFDAFSGVGFATGGNGTLIGSSDRGYSWNLIFSNPGSSIVYRNAAFATSKTASIAGDSGATGKAFLLLTVDGGLTWGPASYPPLNGIYLYSISFLDSLNGMAVGSAGTILKTTDAGWTWTQRYANIPNNLFAVVYTNEVCMAAGSKIIIRSYDLGETWNTSSIDSANGNLFSIFRLDAGNYFVAGE